MCVATLAFASCTALSNAASGDAAATAAGRSCASALVNLYQNYKSVGKVDLTNPTNLSNALIIATSYSQLKQNKGNETYRKAFTSGLISGGAGVITNTNADLITNSLLNSNGLGTISSTNATQNTQAATSLLSIMKSMK